VAVAVCRADVVVAVCRADVVVNVCRADVVVAVPRSGLSTITRYFIRRLPRLRLCWTD